MTAPQLCGRCPYRGADVGVSAAGQPCPHETPDDVTAWLKSRGYTITATPTGFLAEHPTETTATHIPKAHP